MKEFFRYCPACRRRFHIKLVSKKRVKLERTSRRKDVLTSVTGDPRYGGSPAITVVQEDKPVVVDHEEFQYMYKCGHCGHEWTETRKETHREK